MLSVFELNDILERSPVIAAFQEKDFDLALQSPCEILFHLKASVMNIAQRAAQAHRMGKHLFVHIDLAGGIGKDRAGVEYLAQCGVDGFISTKGQLLRYARECGMLTVQRFFLLDSQGIESIQEILDSAAPDLIDLLPGVVTKVIRRFSDGATPVIASGLVETKTEVTEALSCGAAAISTTRKELWYI